MKQYHFLYTLLFMLMVPLGSTAQKAPTRLVFKDGTVIDCQGKLKGNNVKFWKADGAKPRIMAISELEYVQFRYRYKGLETYKSVNVKGYNEPFVLQELVKGRISLYAQRSSEAYTSMGSMGADGGGPMTYSYSNADHYLKKEGKEPAEYLATDQFFHKDFVKASSDYFKDCPSLVQKLKDKVFKKKDIKEVVEYYNEHCGKPMD